MSSFATLILETSTPHASVAIVEPDGTVTQRDFTGDRSHNGGLFLPLEELLGGREAEKIGLVLVGSGPGSYSGTRVGIAAAQGVAIACGCPAIAVPSILAVPAAEAGCLAIGDARRGSFWTAKIAGNELIQPPTLTDAVGLAEIVRTSGLPVITFEDPARFPQLENVLQQFPNAQRLWQAWQSATPTARELWEDALPQPIYLKPPHISQAKRPWLAVPQA